MTDQPPPTPTPATSAAATESAAARVFPCERCGADVTFHIGAQSLKCPYCGHLKPLDSDPAESVSEQSLLEALNRVAKQRGEKHSEDKGSSEVCCGSCGATVRFTGTLTSTECAYCGVPLQLDAVHDAPDRVPVDGVLAFKIDRETARKNLAAWVRSRWFAPNAFKARGVQGRFNGIYLPYWTFDALTVTHYVGQRGEHYTVTVGSGKNKRTVVKTRWYPASGTFQRFFDDVLVVAATGLPKKRVDALEPWPVEKCVSFNQQILAGFLARTYDVSLEDGFNAGKSRMDEALDVEVRRRIGGDTQIVASINSRYDALTYKHLLLPVWMLAYRYGEKPYQVVVNAGTGEVQGDRPYSWLKIALAVIGVGAVAAAVGFGLS